MKNNKKKPVNKNKIIYIAIGIVAGLLLILVAILGISKIFGNKETVVAGIKISDVEIVAEGKYYSYTATLTAKEAKRVDSVDIIFYDEDNKEIKRINSLVNNDFNVNESITINVRTDYNIKDAKKIEYKIN